MPQAPPRLKQQFDSQVAPKIGQDFGIKNPMALPKIEKVVLSVGLGDQLEGTKLNPRAREQVIHGLSMITGQRPVMKRARQAVSNFKLRVGYEVGAMVTVRGDRMWELLDRLFSLAIPRIKDFRGLPTKSFDGRGNYSFGIQEQGIFPEVDMTHATFTHGMNITIVLANSNDEISRTVLTELGLPFRKPATEGRAA